MYSGYVRGLHNEDYLETTKYIGVYIGVPPFMEATKSFRDFRPFDVSINF